MRPEILARLKSLMAQQGLDALVAVSPENFAYVAGFVVPSQPLMRWRHAAYVVTSRGQCAILVVDMEESTTRSKAGAIEVRSWGEFSDSAMLALSGLLSDLGVSRGRVGIEFDYLPAAAFRELSGAMPAVEFAAADRHFARLREIKTPAELELLGRLSRIADRTILDALSAVSVGSTEMDIAAGLTRGIYEQGAEHFKLLIVATGGRSV